MGKKKSCVEEYLHVKDNMEVSFIITNVLIESLRKVMVAVKHCDDFGINLEI